MKKKIISILGGIYYIALLSCVDNNSQVNQNDTIPAFNGNNLVKRGEYLATIGVCSACHTPPSFNESIPIYGTPEYEQELEKRCDPDWVKHLDHLKEMAGGVPFILRFSSTSSGIVYSRNITQDKLTGLGNWSDKEIFDVIRTGKRKDGSSLFLFAPHTFFKNLAEDDVNALVAYLRKIKPVENLIKERNLPFPTQPASDISQLKKAPHGDNANNAGYLLNAIVGCGECHSYHKDGKLNEYVGGDPSEAYIGVFRFGPDLPLRQEEKGLAAFPFPGYAVLYAGNLTRFGKGGDMQNVSIKKMTDAIRKGIAIEKDPYGRDIPLAHVMMWQYYKKMSDEDVNAICKFIKNLNYVPHNIDKRLTYYGTNWDLAFKKVFGEYPSENDKKIFGKLK